MRRREFIVFAGGAVATIPAGALAQRSAPAVVSRRSRAHL